VPAGLVAMPAADPQGQAPSSSLGLAVAPAGSGLDEAQPKAAAQASQAVSAALTQAAPLLNANNPALKGLTPLQQQQLQQVGSVLGTLQKQMQSGQGFTPQQQAQMMQMLRQMQQGASAPQPQGDSSPR